MKTMNEAKKAALVLLVVSTILMLWALWLLKMALRV